MKVRTRRLDADLDLLAAGGSDGVVFVRGKAGLAGRGAAARVPLGEAAEALASMTGERDIEGPGTGPVAFVALPFDRRAWDTAEVVIPEVTWGRRDDGARWVSVAVGEDVPAVGAPAAAAGGPSSFDLAAGRSPESWVATVEDATKAMAAGAFEKVVLAREVTVRADATFDVGAVLGRLRRQFPECFVAHIDGFVAASPELLVGRSGDVVRAHPMAGTTQRTGDPDTDARLAAALLASATYRHEHQVTIDAVHDTLLPWCSYLDYEAEPGVVALSNVQHLATLVEGRLSSPVPSVVELAGALHPTPAVCGRPREAALAFIAEHEGFDRGRYAGAYGWFDAEGNGQFAVSVRCAEIAGNRARVFAGNGIVATSDPWAELAETRAKFQALLGALIRP